jgi:hypothetical protein
MTAKELINYLTDQGYNVYPDPNFIPDLEESQLPALFVFGTGGFGSDDTLPIENPTFQVIVKGKSHKTDYTQMDATETLAKQLIIFLEKKNNYMVGNSLIYVSRAMQSNPIPLGLDIHDRPTYSTNFRFKLAQT